MDHSCSMCPYFSNSQADLLKHLVKRHRNTSKFIIHCGSPGCGASFKIYKSFKVHCARKHFTDDKLSSIVSEEQSDVPELVDDEQNDPDSNEEYSQHISEAAFILKLISCVSYISGDGR